MVFAKLFDVAPDGTERMIPRDVAAVRIAGQPGVATARTIDLRGVTHRVAAGHRLRVVLASTDAAFTARSVADTYTVSGPVELTLPVLTHDSKSGGPIAVGLGAMIGVVALAVGLIATRRPSSVTRRSELP